MKPTGTAECPCEYCTHLLETEPCTACRKTPLWLGYDRAPEHVTVVPAAVESLN